MPAKAGIQTWPHMLRPWIPAFAGMTVKDLMNDAAIGPRRGTAPATFYILPGIL